MVKSNMARPWTVDRDDNSISRSDAMYKDTVFLFRGWGVEW
jgi:hypothetical protein